MKIIRKYNSLSILFLTLFLVLTLAGCGNKEQAFYGNGEHSYAESEAAQKMTWELPSLEEIDPGMSNAHFISAPAYSMESEYELEYSASYDLKVDGTSACFAISDGTGEFGRMVIYELYGPTPGSDEKAQFYISTSDRGVVKERINSCEVEASSDGNYHVELKVSLGDNSAADDMKLEATVNGQQVALDTVPCVGVGAIGTYKGRSQTYGYIDNILVTGAADAVLYKEDFEGDNDIFDPYFAYIDNGWMRVESGFTLTEIKGTPAPIFRKEFSFAGQNGSSKNTTEGFEIVQVGDGHKIKDMTSATLYMTALGAFDASVNGSRVSPNVLDPGVLDYGDELKYVGYDVTPLIKEDNVLEVTLAHGWFDRGLGFPEIASPWGDKLAIKGELVIRYKDGSFDIIPTDDKFKVTYDNCVRFDDVYQGEIYDDNYSDNNTNAASVADADGESKNAGNAGVKNYGKHWQNVEVDEVDERWISLSVAPKENEPIREVMELYAQAVAEPEPGVFVYDFGRNVSGMLSIDMTGETALGQGGDLKKPVTWDSLGVGQGDVLTFRYGETLNMEGMANSDGAPGTLWTQNLLTARATDYLVVGANSSPFVSFRYTVHGFRYVEVRGLKAEIPSSHLKVSMVSADLDVTGEFSCDDAEIQALYDNAVISIRSNFVDNPTDCNQRDERLGWAGDAQISSNLACYVFDTKRFYEKYLDAMVNRQDDRGAFADTAPSRIGGSGNNCWGDAPVVIAWNLYTMYGDKAVLEKYYEPCCRWVDFLVSESTDYVRDVTLAPDGGHSYGDHISEQGTPVTLTDTAWCAHSAELVSKMAAALGDADGASKYGEVASKYKEAWRERFIRPDGSVEAGLMTEESETGYALGICFGLFDESMMQDAADRLSILADYSGYPFYPGYSGLSYFLPALARYGHADTAFKVMKQHGPLTLMNTLDCGMTSMPETLSAYRFDENGLLSINGSLNHYAYASVLAFAYTDILGIRADEEKPGFEHFYLEPVRYGGAGAAIGAGSDGEVPGGANDGSVDNVGGFGDAKGSLKTSYGVIEVARDAAGYHVTVPESTTATVVMPNGDVYDVEAGKHDFGW